MTGGQLKAIRSSLRLSGTSSRFSGTSPTSKWMSFKQRTSPAYEDDGWQPPKAEKNWWHAIFAFSGISLLACLLQIFLPPPYGLRMTSYEVAEIGIAPEGCDDGLERCICPRATVCATNVLSMALLACARCTAFFDYPLYAMMFLSKAHNVNNVLRRTVLREWIDFADMHHVHSIFGKVIGIETMSHSFFHLLRWGINSDIRLLWETDTGVTGLIAMCATPLIVWPMLLPRLKQTLRFEVRKGLHYLVYVWAASLMRHAPARIYYMIGAPFLLYVVDFFFGFFVRNHLIENVYFERYGEEGVALHFENPKGFNAHKTSYVYIMCPWISKWQWHAFTAFPEPAKKYKEGTMLCINAGGDWTKKLHEMIKSPCLRPVYVAGPFSSEFSDIAVDTVNAIAIASGIGITPTLSLMISYAGKKRINVVWICRDPGLVEYVLHKMDISAVTEFSFIMIYYTGKRELLLPKNLPINIFVFRSRPELEEVITGIVAAIHYGEGLPEEMYENQKALNEVCFNERIKVALCRVTAIYSKEEMFQYAVDETDAESLVREDQVDPEAVRGKHAPKSVKFADSDDATPASRPPREPRSNGGGKRAPKSVKFADSDDATPASRPPRETRSNGGISAVVDRSNKGPGSNGPQRRACVRWAVDEEEGAASPDGSLEDCVRDFSLVLDAEIASIADLDGTETTAEISPEEDYVDLEAGTRENGPKNIPSRMVLENWSFGDDYEGKSSSSSESDEGYHEFLRLVEGNGDNQVARMTSRTVDESRLGGVVSAFMDNLREDAGTDDDAYQTVDGDYVGSVDESESDDGADAFIDNLKEDEESDDDDRLVSVDGLEKMIGHFLGGIGDYSRLDIEKFFNQVNTGQSGLIDQEEFDRFIDLAKGERRSGRISEVTHERLKRSMQQSMRNLKSTRNLTNAPLKEFKIGDASSIRYVENMAHDIEKPLKDWSMFYCGASSFIEKTLRDISEKYKIDVGVERFDW